MKAKSEQSETLALIGQVTGKDLSNSAKLLEFWEKKAEVRQRSEVGTVFLSGVTFGSGGGSFFGSGTISPPWD